MAVKVVHVLTLNWIRGLSVDADEETELLTVMSSEPADARDVADGALKLQMVMEIDMDIWRVSST